MIRIFKHYISRWSVLLILAEAVVFVGAVYAGVHLRFLGQPKPDLLHAEESLLVRALVFAAVMIACMTITGRYRRLLEDGLSGEALKVVLSFVIGTVAMSLLFYLMPELFLGRGAFGYVLLVALVLVLLLRWLIHEFFLDMEVMRRRLLVIGTGRDAAAIGHHPSRTWSDGKVVGYWPVDDREPLVDPGLVVHPTTAMLGWVRQGSICAVVVAADHRHLSPAIVDALLECKTNGIQVMGMISFFEQELRLIQMELLTPYWWIIHSDGLNRGTLRAVFKRLFDLVMSVLLLVLTSPLMLLTVLAIGVESRGVGSAIYRQVRVGYGGKQIKILKFRSMCTDAEPDGVPRWATENDHRITTVGRFIRHTRIDELPQLINVIRGEMSLVGPRPERPAFVSMLRERIPFYTERLRVKPGITGWAQICYGYGSSEKDAMAKLQYDLYYVKNHSLFLDLLVLIQSVEVVLFGRESHGPGSRT